MFERFTERSRKVMALAQEEATRFNHNYIGTEHLLLGLVSEGDGVAARVLTNLGVRLTKVRNAVTFIVGRGEAPAVGEIGLTPRAKRAIELGVDEARRLNHHYIGTEHLLLGLLREGQGIAAGVLESLGVSLEHARREVLHIVDPSGSHATTEDSVTGGPALRELARVMPVGQNWPPPHAGQQKWSPGFEITLLSLESYADGFILNCRLLFPDEAPTYEPNIAWEVNDDQGGSYETRSCGSGRLQRQWRLSYSCSPALDPAARELRVGLGGLNWSSDRPHGGSSSVIVDSSITFGQPAFVVQLPEQG
jgi:hypothetical protein